jgi:hypothetical protein
MLMMAYHNDQFHYRYILKNVTTLQFKFVNLNPFLNQTNTKFMKPANSHKNLCSPQRLNDS